MVCLKFEHNYILSYILIIIPIRNVLIYFVIYNYYKLIKEIKKIFYHFSKTLKHIVITNHKHVKGYPIQETTPIINLVEFHCLHPFH